MAVARHLAGLGPATEEMGIAAICEAFNCLPSQAVREPSRLVARVMETRAFMHAWDSVSRLEKPQGPLGELAAQCYIDLVVKPKQDA